MLLDDSIRTAIAEKRIVEFNYDGYHRIAEPHVYGISHGKYELPLIIDRTIKGY